MIRHFIRTVPAIAVLVFCGSGLVIAVVERPTINRISIEGNRRLEDEDLLTLIGSQSRRVMLPSQVEADAAAISDAYAAQARLSASVTPRIIRRSDNRVDVVFEISEGRGVENMLPSISQYSLA